MSPKETQLQGRLVLRVVERAHADAAIHAQKIVSNYLQAAYGFGGAALTALLALLLDYRVGLLVVFLVSLAVAGTCLVMVRDQASSRERAWEALQASEREIEVEFGTTVTVRFTDTPIRQGPPSTGSAI
jgi:predicted membrane metal-binding protein